MAVLLGENGFFFGELIDIGSTMVGKISASVFVDLGVVLGHLPYDFWGTEAPAFKVLIAVADNLN